MLTIVRENDDKTTELLAGLTLDAGRETYRQQTTTDSRVLTVEVCDVVVDGDSDGADLMEVSIGYDTSVCGNSNTVSSPEHWSDGHPILRSGGSSSGQTIDAASSKSPRHFSSKNLGIIGLLLAAIEMLSSHFLFSGDIIL